MAHTAAGGSAGTLNPSPHSISMSHVRVNNKVYGPDQIVLNGVSKQFTIEGRDDAVHALRNINLAAENEIYPIRQGCVSVCSRFRVSEHCSMQPRSRIACIFTHVRNPYSFSSSVAENSS